MQLESVDALHHRVAGAPTLMNGRKARALFDAVLAGLKAATGEESGERPVIEVSLGDVTDGNSVLVSLMLVWLRRARQIGVDMQFVDVPPLVMNLIEFTGLDDVVPVGASGDAV